MESEQIIHLVFDLEVGTIIRQEGDVVDSEPAASQSWQTIDSGSLQGWWIGSIFEGNVERALRQCNRNDFSPFQRVDGDFICIGFDSETEHISLINDRNGKYRLYYYYDGSKIHISNHLWTLAVRLDELQISGFGLYNYLATGHIVDPWTLFDSVKALEIGQAVVVSQEGKTAEKYHEFVDRDPPLYESVDVAVDALDAALTRVLEKRTSEGRKPVVFLSGGIDSLTMMHYLRRVTGAPPSSLTFSMEGTETSDERAARRAAEHFGGSHELVDIEPADSWDYFVDGLTASDTPQPAATIFQGVKEAASERFFGPADERTLFLGQDSRLATPSYDKGKELGIKQNVFKLPLGPLEKAALNALEVAGHWPYRGGGAARTFVNKARERPTAERYLLEAYFGYEPGVEYPEDYERLVEELAINHAGDMEKLHRALVHFQTRWQHTDNMNEVRAAFESPSNRVDLPFFDHAFISAANRVCFRDAVEPTLTLKSDHPFPIARKRILRELLGETLSDDILWRRDWAAFPQNRLLNKSFRRAAGRLLVEYREAIYDHLDPSYHQVLGEHLEPIIGHLPDDRPPVRPLFWFLYIASIFAARETSQRKGQNTSFLKEFAEW